MRVIDVLKLGKEILQVCGREGVRPGDVQYIALWNDYRHMIAQGEKVTYIVALLAARYNICERKVYQLIKRFGAECQP